MDMLKSTAEFDDLPPEILTIIFQYLSTRDRANIRRVCKKWYQCASTKLILQTEKLVLHNIYPMPDALRLVARSDRPYMNLEFRSITFCGNTTPFWKYCGHRIRRLQFSYCTLDEHNFQELVTHCHSLECFTWFYSAFSSNMKRALLNLEKIKNKNLRSLRLHLRHNHSPHMSNYILHRIFEIFPAIADITLVCNAPTTLYFRPIFVEPEMLSLDTLTFRTVFHKLKTSPERIRKLNVSTGHTLAKKKNYFIHILNLVPNLRSLTEISIQMTANSDSDQQRMIFTYFANLPLLERAICSFEIDLEAPVDDNEFVRSFLTVLFKGSPNLRHLSLSYIRKIHVARELFQKIVESRLNALLLEFSDLSIEKGDPLLNSTLHRLGLVLWARNEDTANLLLKTFVSLRYLEISESSISILDMLANHQTRMMEIKLMAGTYSRLAPPRETQPSNSANDDSYSCDYKLKCLETLEMNLKSSRNAFQAFSILVSRSLKKLTIRMPGALQVCSKIVNSLVDLPELESVELQCECKSFLYENWLEVCSKLKKLRYVLIDDRSKINNNQFENMFFCCPSLRIVKCGSELFYYDVIRKSIRKRL